MVDWLLEPRSPSLRRLEPVAQFGWSSLSMTARWNTSSSLQVTGDTAALAALAVPGNGIVVTRDGARVFSGPMVEAKPAGDGTTVVTFVSDLQLLWDRICPPTPAAAWNAQGDVYTMSGPLPTAFSQLVDVNAAAGATAARRIPGLVVGAAVSTGTPPTIKKTLRYDSLGQTLSDLAVANDYTIDVTHDESTGTPRLVFTVRPVVDRSALVSFGTVQAGGPGILGEDWSLDVTAPTATFAVVGGSGEAEARIIVTAANSPDEATWGRRVETFLDQRQTDDNTELTTAGTDQLTTSQAAAVFSGVIANTPQLRYGTDWNVGDLVAFQVAGTRIVDVIREVGVSVEVQQGATSEQVAPKIGRTDPQADPVRSTLIDSLVRTARIERSY